MKIVLMVAAGVALGLTAAIAVLIQVLERLLPLVLVAVLVVIVVKLARGRLGRRAITAQRAFVAESAPTPPLPIAPTAPRATNHAPSLHWGPPVYEDLDLPALEVASGPRARGTGAGTNPHRHRP
ncbi:MAG: hypothetical protein K0U84_08815 [Actinomycetia bacterium]|nr:hypothetical protein [Actinomycetes bacterium]